MNSRINTISNSFSFHPFTRLFPTSTICIVFSCAERECKRRRSLEVIYEVGWIEDNEE